MVSGAGWKRSMNQSFRRIKKTTTSSYNLTKAPHEETGEAPLGDWFQTTSSSRFHSVITSLRRRTQTGKKG